jgi:hypothetical protein
MNNHPESGMDQIRSNPAGKTEFREPENKRLRRLPKPTSPRCCAG